MAPASQSTSHRNLGLAGGCQFIACEQPGRADSSAPSPNLLASSNAPAGQEKILTPASSSSLLTLNLFLGSSEPLGCTPTRSVQGLSVNQLVPHPISRGLPASQSQVCRVSGHRPLAAAPWGLGHHLLNQPINHPFRFTKDLYVFLCSTTHGVRENFLITRLHFPPFLLSHYPYPLDHSK